MDNLVFSLNATVPIFLMMILGLFFNKIGWMDEEFANKMNKFVFRIPLPVLLFGDLAVVDIKEAWDTKFVIFCFIITLISITSAIGISCLLKDRSIQGEFIQGAYRSSAALLGIAFIQNIYGNSGQAPLMIIGSVPLYNIMAVVVLSFFKPGQSKIDKEVLKKGDTMSNIKTERISDALIEQISYIIANEVKNGNIKFVTITDVKVSSDLSYAKVYFTVLDESKINETTKALKEASGFIRHELRDRVDIRQIPELTFVYDESIKHAQKIEDIIDKLHEEGK